MLLCKCKDNYYGFYFGYSQFKKELLFTVIEFMEQKKSKVSSINWENNTISFFIRYVFLNMKKSEPQNTFG